MTVSSYKRKGSTPGAGQHSGPANIVGRSGEETTAAFYPSPPPKTRAIPGAAVLLQYCIVVRIVSETWNVYRYPPLCRGHGVPGLAWPSTVSSGDRSPTRGSGLPTWSSLSPACARQSAMRRNSVLG